MFALASQLQVKSPFELIQGKRQVDHAGQVTRASCVPFFHSSFPWHVPTSASQAWWAALLENNVDVQ